MSFTTAYEKWYQDHLERRSGERKDRLKRGLGHGEKVFLEKVWWPLFGHFDGLHPEYEVADWRNMNYFVDLMWRMGSVSIAFEIKGYGPHVQQTDRTRYRRELNREMFLQGLGFQVVSILCPDEHCSIFGTWGGAQYIIQSFRTRYHAARYAYREGNTAG